MHSRTTEDDYVFGLCRHDQHAPAANFTDYGARRNAAGECRFGTHEEFDTVRNEGDVVRFPVTDRDVLRRQNSQDFQPGAHRTPTIQSVRRFAVQHVAADFALRFTAKTYHRSVGHHLNFHRAIGGRMASAEQPDSLVWRLAKNYRHAAQAQPADLVLRAVGWCQRSGSQDDRSGQRPCTRRRGL